MSTSGIIPPEAISDHDFAKLEDRVESLEQMIVIILSVIFAVMLLKANKREEAKK